MDTAVSRTITIVATLFWLSVAPALGQTAPPAPSPCSSKNCKSNAASSGLSGKALSQCLTEVIAACNATTCTCGPSGTCNAATQCPPCLSLKYTTQAGTTSCGGTRLSPAPRAPFSGTLDSDTTCATRLDDLGSSCLYIGDGGNGAVPGGPTPAGAASYLDNRCVGGTNPAGCCLSPANCPGGGACDLVASNGTGMTDCTKGSGPTSECVDAGTCVGGTNPGVNCFNATDCLGGGTCTGPNPHVSCTADAGCGGVAGSCQLTANCFFGPPLAIPNPAIASLASCNINVIASDGSGVGDPTTGAATVDLPLQTRVYITANNTSPCPKCNCGTPPCSGRGKTGCTYGPNAGGACSTNSTTGVVATSNTSQDCPPEEGGGLFGGAIAVTLNPLTTGTSSMTGTGGSFCPSQVTPGAFGVGENRCTVTFGGCTSNANCSGGTDTCDTTTGLCTVTGRTCTSNANCDNCNLNGCPPGNGATCPQCIVETGMAAGNLTDGAPHAAREGVAFCIPATANGTVNFVVGLPGPGATSLPGLAQIVPTP